LFSIIFGNIDEIFVLTVRNLRISNLWTLVGFTGRVRRETLIHGGKKEENSSR